MKIGVMTSNNQPLMPHVMLANNLWTRFKGLLGHGGLTDEQGMLITPCNAVHTMWMRFSIDVVFLDKDGHITRIYRHLKPWRMAGCKQSTHVLELGAGMAEQYALKPGQQLTWQVPPLTQPTPGA